MNILKTGARQIKGMLPIRIFRRELLPAAEEFLCTNTQRFRRYGRRARAVCPFYAHAEHQVEFVRIGRAIRLRPETAEKMIEAGTVPPPEGR